MKRKPKVKKRDPVPKKKSHEPEIKSGYNAWSNHMEAMLSFYAGAEQIVTFGPRTSLEEIDQHAPEELLKQARKRLYEDKGWELLEVSDTERRPYVNPRQHTVYEQYENKVFNVPLPSDELKALYVFDHKGEVEVIHTTDPNIAIINELEKAFQIENFKENEPEPKGILGFFRKK